MKIRVAILVSAICAASPALAKKEPELSGLELQQIQAKDLETTASIAFPAVMTVLQDAGYRIQSADKDTGLITAIGSTQSKLTWNIWFGLGSKKKIPIVSAFIEPRGPQYTRIRLNFVMSEGKSRQAFTDEKPISDPAIYRDAFEKIEKEVFVRLAMESTPAAQPSGVPVTTAVTAIVPAGSETPKE